MVIYRSFSGKHGIWKRVTEHVASVQWLDKQLTRDFNLLTNSLVLTLLCFFSAGLSWSLIRSNGKQERYGRAAFWTNQHVKQGKAFINYDQICKMTQKLVSILTLAFSETFVEIVGNMGQSLSDDFTMFLYLRRPILLAKFENSRRKKRITIYVLF